MRRGTGPRVPALSLAVALALLGCERAAAPGLPPPPAGWRLADGPTQYRPDTLWRYLDGGAPQYLAFGLRRLAHGRYERETDPGAAVTLDIFEMGSELGAFGIYSRGRSPEDPIRDWGAEGYRIGNVAAAWKGSLYVHAEADDAEPGTIALMEALVAAACDAAPGTTSPPPILRALPEEGRVSRSERYTASNLLGHAFLPAGVSARYRAAEGEAVLFFSDLGSATAAAEAIGRLRSHEVERGAGVEDLASPGAGGFRCTDPGLGRLTATTAGRFVAGVYGDLPHEALLPILEPLLPNLRSLP